MTGAFPGPAEHLIPGRPAGDAGADTLDRARELGAFSGGEGDREAGAARTGADVDFARVDSGRPHPDQYLAVGWLAQLDVFDPQDVESAVVVETHCSYHVNPFKG